MWSAAHAVVTARAVGHCRVPEQAGCGRLADLQGGRSTAALPGARLLPGPESIGRSPKHGRRTRPPRPGSPPVAVAQPWVEGHGRNHCQVAPPNESIATGTEPAFPSSASFSWRRATAMARSSHAGRSAGPGDGEGVGAFRVRLDGRIRRTPFLLGSGRQRGSEGVSSRRSEGASALGKGSRMPVVQVGADGGHHRRDLVAVPAALYVLVVVQRLAPVPACLFEAAAKVVQYVRWSLAAPASSRGLT
ncbi:hypothetical protein DC74_8146 [Streptomyces noursei]|nr:hypothetical protein DC74_8146 [Streptomyces noursei]